MTLIKSISGMRGTIGGRPGQNLTPVDIVEMTSAYAHWVLAGRSSATVVTGRDGRISGEIVSGLVVNTLRSMGIHVVDLGLSTTPTVEMMVLKEKADGGIILTASHNPREWNALKLLNARGEFISAADGEEILKIASGEHFEYADTTKLGTYREQQGGFDYHVDRILALPYIDVAQIKSRKFHVAVDCINSTGALAIPFLLDALGCTYQLLNNSVSGEFAHNPEPLPENIQGLCAMVKAEGYDLGIAVDPDVDRLVFVTDNGEPFGEEYTLVGVADYILTQRKGPAVSNLSSTRALRDLCDKYGVAYHAAAVGEVNVVEKMKSVDAVIGGEGNGGVILPELHYGRDALAGIAVMLGFLAHEKTSLSQLKNRYTQYVIVKDKVYLGEKMDVSMILDKIRNAYLEERIDETDGLKIDLDDGWIHIRKSNTEPVVRIIAESHSKIKANDYINDITNIINESN